MVRDLKALALLPHAHLLNRLRDGVLELLRDRIGLTRNHFVLLLLITCLIVETALLHLTGSRLLLKAGQLCQVQCVSLAAMMTFFYVLEVTVFMIQNAVGRHLSKHRLTLLSRVVSTT